MAGLSFVTPLAYDWKYAFAAIRSYFAIADEIILGLDADRISWSKKRFFFDDQAVADWIAETDTEKKIRIIEGNFHTHDAPFDNDTAERRELGMACRGGNWVVQIDSDEILLNPLDFRSFMSSVVEDVSVWARLMPVYKIIGDKALVVGGQMERAPVATRVPQRYLCARETNQPQLVSPLHMLHLTWCRSEEELVQKLTHWGHSQQIDVEKAVNVWRGTTLENYHQLKDFHPFHGPLWQYLTVMDWPASPFDGKTAFKLAPGVWKPNAQGSRVIIDGRTRAGGMFVTFAAPAGEGKDSAR